MIKNPYTRLEEAILIGTCSIGFYGELTYIILELSSNTHTIYSSESSNHFVSFQNQVHVNIGGGRDNLIENNIMYNATSFSMQVDGRGVKHDHDTDLLRKLKV